MPEQDALHLESWIKQQVKAAGFELCRITKADVSSHIQHVKNWLNTGQHGEMNYLENYLDKRLDVRELLAGAQSVICVADRLPINNDNLNNNENTMPLGFGKVARYVQMTDYHKAMKKRLIKLADLIREREPNHDYKVCVDTAPVLEREHAHRAGMGWVGKHTLLINRHVGSHIMLGEIITTLDLKNDTPETDHCGTCTRCIDACPTKCITPYSVDGSRCISYLNIEFRDELPVEDHPGIGDWLFGCDICQDVCPHNQKVPASDVGQAYETRSDRFDLLEVLGWNEDDRRQAFTKSALKRAKLAMFKRNALIVLGNQISKLIQADQNEKMKSVISDYIKRIKAIAQDTSENEIVQHTANNVLTILNKI